MPSHCPDILVWVINQVITVLSKCCIALNVEKSMVTSFKLFYANLGYLPGILLTTTRWAAWCVEVFLDALPDCVEVSVSISKPLSYPYVAQHFFQSIVRPFVAFI